VDSLVTLPDESIPFEGTDRPCAVLEVRYRPGFGGPTLPGVPRRFWIDRDRHLVLQHRTITRTASPDGQRSVEQSETFRYRTIALDGPPDASLFTFQAPPGAKKVDQFGSGSRGVEDLSGQTATDFTLADLSGKKHSLKALRGKVVMLDFWASWCGPCRRQMPLVEKLGKELEPKGLVVYAVNQGESAETARRYLEKNRYGTTTLLDSKLEVGKQYKAVGIPTLVIIDRQGKIAAHYVGVRGEEVLREGLRKAGL
jgi:thiol-disulfide isomerase/thioredoxin